MFKKPKQTAVCGHVAASVARPWLLCGCSVGESVNDGGSAASSCTSAEVKRMAHDAFHVNKRRSLFVSAVIWGMRSAPRHGCRLLFSCKTRMQQKCQSTELLFHHNYPQRSMSDAPNAKNVPNWPFQIRLQPAFSLCLWPHFPVGSGWGVSFGQTEGSRGRAAYVCMRLKLAVVFFSHTVGLSSCFHCPSLLPIDRREDKREREMLLHCHKFLLSGRP